MMIFRKTIAWVIVVLVVASGFFYYYEYDAANEPANNGGQACTLEAKLCPDGSRVGRAGPNCEFAACPVMNMLKTFTDSSVTFQYPEKLDTKYIAASDWPPKAQLVSGPFTCAEAGSETAPTGKTARETVNGKTYCVTKESEGAAGSTYALYAYAFPKNNKVVILTFGLQFIQCGNYDATEMVACDAERTSFDISTIIDEIAESLVLNI